MACLGSASKYFVVFTLRNFWWEGFGLVLLFIGPFGNWFEEDDCKYWYFNYGYWIVGDLSSWFGKEYGLFEMFGNILVEWF